MNPQRELAQLCGEAVLVHPVDAVAQYVAAGHLDLLLGRPPIGRAHLR